MRCVVLRGTVRSRPVQVDNDEGQMLGIEGPSLQGASHDRSGFDLRFMKIQSPCVAL